jgi:hypothetical protein
MVHINSYDTATTLHVLPTDTQRHNRFNNEGERERERETNIKREPLGPNRWVEGLESENEDSAMSRELRSKVG